MFGALQREYLGTLLACDHHRIHVSAADGAKHFLRLGQAHAEIAQAIGFTVQWFKVPGSMVHGSLVQWIWAMLSRRVCRASMSSNVRLS